MIAFVLINVTGQKVQDAFHTLVENEHVTQTHVVFGDIDIIAEVHVANEEELSALDTDLIRKLPGVIRATVYVVAPSTE